MGRKATKAKATEIKMTKKGTQTLSKAPLNIKEYFYTWVDDVRTCGLEYTKSIDLYRDHPLQRERVGERSVSLGPLWRAIYREKKGRIVVVTVLEVTPHEY
jgi:toxin HigB-1